MGATIGIFDMVCTIFALAKLCKFALMAYTRDAVPSKRGGPTYPCRGT